MYVCILHIHIYIRYLYTYIIKQSNVARGITDQLHSDKCYHIVLQTLDTDETLEISLTFPH